MFLTFFTVFCVLFGSSCGLREKEVCNGGNVEIDLFPYNSYQGPLYFYPREGGVRKVLMENREAKDPRLVINTSSVKLTKLTEKDNGEFAIIKNYGVVFDILSLTINDCSTEILLFNGEDLAHDIPSNAELLEFTSSHGSGKPKVQWQRRYPYSNYGGRGTVSGNVFRISDVTYEDDGVYNFRDEDKTVVLRLRLIVKELHNAGIYVIVALVAGVVIFLCCCCYCCRKCCCSKDKPPSEVAQTAAEPKVFYHDLTQPEGSGFSAAPHPAAFPPPAGNVQLPPPSGSTAFPPPTGNVSFPTPSGSAAFPPPAGNASFPPASGSAAFPPPAGNVPFPTPSGSAAFPSPVGNVSFPPPAGSAAFPSPVGNAGIPYDAASASSGPVSYQPTYEIKNISQPQVAPGASEKSAPSSSFDYNPLSSDYQPTFEVKGQSFNFNLPLSSENSFADVYNSDKMNFL